jgi:hypothetical protein
MSSKNGDRARANKHLKKRRVARQQLRVIRRTLSPSDGDVKSSQVLLPLEPRSRKLI